MDLATAVSVVIFLLSMAFLYGPATRRIQTWPNAKHFFVFLFSVVFLYGQITTRIPSRLHPNQVPKSRFELVPVGGNSSQIPAAGVDIIFIHGLGSNPDTTWRATRPAATADAPERAAPDSDQFVTWVSDFLPDDFPPPIRKNVRVYFYNYDSYWKRDALQTRLANLGNELLEHINGEIRASERERSRNLIFVGYSYGGLVIKQALVQAQTNRDLGHVAEHTRAILFLGTPHRGSSFSAWGWLAAQALQLLGSNPALLANLEYDSTPLLDLHRAFAGIPQDNWRVFNFFEQRPTQIFSLWFLRWQQFCVREQSATYDGPRVRNIGLSVDHYQLNKFGSRSESYRTILLKLIEVVTPLAHQAKHHYVVPLDTVHTYTERAELSNELKQKLQIRHEKASVPHAVTLYGLGGAGKSQLALDYAEKHKGRYNPILWIDATDQEAVRSSFRRCAAELGLQEEGTQKQESVLTDGVVQAVLRWLRDRSEADDEWLVIIDNADDVSWGIQRIMPKGIRGSVIVTSRDEQSTWLVPRGCEQVYVGTMSPVEGASLLLQHLQLDIQSASKEIRQSCDKVIKRLGYLALAIDLAGAYIGSDSAPEQALSQYLTDFDRHRDKLLRMDRFRGLLPTQMTVWTVWDTTLEKIRTEDAHLQPGTRLQPELLLMFLAQFKGSIVQDEMFRLASLGIAAVDAELGDEAVEGIPANLRHFLPLNNGEWDSFRYRQSRNVLVRYSLLQRVEDRWPGVTMHSLVQWRAMQSEVSRARRWWYITFVLAACRQISGGEGQPEFRRHLIVHLLDIGEKEIGDENWRKHGSFVKTTLGRIYYDEGRWEEAEKLFVEVMETRKTKLGADHPDTLISMANLALTFWNQGRWEEAEKLFMEVTETRKTKLGADHPDTLISMANLASTYRNQGRWEEAEKLFVEVMETRKTKLGADHPDMLMSMANLASTYRNQGRWEEAEKLFVEVMETSKTKLGANHPDTLMSMANLASTYRNQGRWEEAEKLEVEVIETSKTKLGADHPNTLTSMANLALTFWNQGRWEEAEKLFVEVMETRKTKLGADHPDTLISMANLALTYRNQGRWEEAEKLNVEAIEASKTKLGADHPDTLTSIANLVVIYIDQGRWEEATKLNVEVMETRKTKLGSDHPDTLTSIANLASTYQNQGWWDEAEKLFVEVIETSKTKLGADHPNTLTSMANLASTYRNQGRWEEAEKLSVEVMETRKTKLGADHPDTLMSMNNLAFAWKSQGRDADALALMESCAGARRRVLGARHPDTISSMATVEAWR